MRSGAPVELSVVVPVYGCAPCLDELRQRINASLEAHRVAYEIIFVNDASRDNSGEVLARLSSVDARVVVISHPDNRGQHAAIAHGLERASGSWAAVIDCDLQDPPELLPQMLSLARERADIVVGRRGLHGQAWWRRVGSAVVGAAARHRHGSGLVGTHSVFSVVSRRAVEGYLRHDGHGVMYLPVLETLGLDVVSFDYDRAARAAGRSTYGASGLVRRAWRLLATPPAPRDGSPRR